ncbi:hypothetical protein NUU61_001419 [Penicillium alfredii]|uniref:ATP-dependent DNA helicase n=1 Tax=Penicillium alfredii TaxID=1506179 RepID=A0A9W9G435_9EURO|nr:uncharacterized protein NUU61_001419 [Penicillium alfredii]KAJ5111789.1 hypothetical protein NUU61_001419 [Penicillium alfredii]
MISSSFKGRHYIKHVLPAARKPTDKDFVVLCLLLVTFQGPLQYNHRYLPRLCPSLHGVRSARIAPGPGNLSGIKHVISVANGDPVVADSPPCRKGSLLRSLLMALKTAFLHQMYSLQVGHAALYRLCDHMARAKEPFNHRRHTTVWARPSAFCVMSTTVMLSLPNRSPPDVSSSDIRKSVSRYEEETSTAAKTSVCSSCGRFVLHADIHYMDHEDPLLLPLNGVLDHCGRQERSWTLCTSCHRALGRAAIPKFSAKNLVNVTLCQGYPSALEGLTLTEEYAIARCHPLGLIVKLRPGGRLSSISHRALRGHFIVIPQDPGPLLQILPSAELRLENLIKVFWLGDRPPSDTDLRPHLVIRKQRVLAALQYLARYNHLYRGLTINQPMMDGWSDEFIPRELRDNIIRLDEPDHQEREGYTVNLAQGNYENDLQAAQDEAAQDQSLDSNDGGHFLTGSVSTDINGERQNPDIRVLDTLLDVITNGSRLSEQCDLENPDSTDSRSFPSRHIPAISYKTHDYVALMDHWSDPHYYTAAFPTLFPQGVGGHLNKRVIPVSLSSFAEWALNHHSRRFLVKRRYWRSAADDIASLTVDQLQKAAEAIASGQNTNDPVIQRLQQHIVTVGMNVPGSFSQKLRMRSEIRGLIVRYGMPAFWITINPSDLRNPLVLTLAGVECPGSISARALAATRDTAATSNPVAVAEFFHCVCEAVLRGLLATGTGQLGILGDLSNHYGVVETNGRGMLHMHALLWLRGNLAFTTLRNRVLNDSEFAARMIRYLEATIIQSIDDTIPHDPEVNLPSTPPSAKEMETDTEFFLRLWSDSNSVAKTTQIHSKHHLSTCFKYRQRGSGKDACRFGMPRDLIPISKVDDFGLIQLARNHPWTNPWNPAIASCVRSNHDISWIPTVSKSLSLIYYITNYATKDDVSPWQIVAKAALLKQRIERAQAAESPTTTDLRLQKTGLDNFALRCFNTLSHDREISGVQVASILLNLPTYYTINYNFKRINLWWLRQYMRHIIEPTNVRSDSSSASLDEEPCTYEAGSTGPISIFDNYRWRGPHLACLTLFEYCMLVRTKHVRDAIVDDVDFDSSHPQSKTHVQRLARTSSQIATVTFNGQLTEFQASEDAVPGGHPKMVASMNDLAEILLGLFVPWDHLPALFQEHAVAVQPKRDACSQIWTIVEPTLTSYKRNFAGNIELLRKSKEDGEADAKLRQPPVRVDSLFDRDSNELDIRNLDSEADESLENLAETVSAETLIAAYQSITKCWDREVLATERRIPSLAHTTPRNRGGLLQNLLPLNIFDIPGYGTSALHFFSPSTLQRWSSRLKELAKLGDDGVVNNDTMEPVYEMDDFSLNITDGMLEPALNEPTAIPTLPDQRSLVDDNYTPNSLTSLVNESIPLNAKQRLVVERVLSEALHWADHPYNPSKRHQTLLYVGGEGGVGKSQIIKGILAGMDLLRRREEVIIMAPTGAAADNIGGNTFHTSLGISVTRTPGHAITSRVRKLWSRKTIMITDEVSMMDLSMLSVINNHCKMARSLDRGSPDLFGGLPMVILMGDFFQFPPVRGPALWKEPRRGNAEDENGRLIWHQFRDVIVLDEQMRQSEDLSFRTLLHRARTSTLTEDDLHLLNSGVVTSLVAPQLDGTTTIVKLNSLRHQVNRIRMEHFAEARSHKIYAFPAHHTRTKSTGPTNLRLCVDDLLQQPDQGTMVPFPGIFLYTPNMPSVILTNICTRLGQVNGATGIAVGIVVDPAGE